MGGSALYFGRFHGGCGGEMTKKNYVVYERSLYAVVLLAVLVFYELSLISLHRRI